MRDRDMVTTRRRALRRASAEHAKDLEFYSC